MEEEAKKERDAIRRQRKREIVREDRMERAGIKKSKLERDQDRDISEKIALGQAQPMSRETMFDQRLFNQTAGLGAGFGHEDDYNLFDKPLFHDRTAASIYKGVKGVDNEIKEEAEQENVRKALKSGFEGSDVKHISSRSKPVEFEKKRLESQNDFVGGLQKK